MRRIAFLMVLIAAGWCIPIAAQEAQTQLEERVANGLKIYKSRENECDSCHAWTGNGKPADHPYGTKTDDTVLEYGGNSLVASTMTRDEMIMTISCGRIAGINIMPAYRGDAWTPKYPCWGKTAADISPLDKPLGPPTRFLSPSEIELVVDYVQAVYQGKEMTWDNCRHYFDDFLRICEVWRDHGVQR